MRAVRTIALALLALGAGCYHYTFVDSDAVAATPARYVRIYKVRRATYLNGFVGNGRIDTSAYCAQPLATELRVTAADVAIGALTLLIVTPHTLYVTCPVPERPSPATSTAGTRRRRL